MADLIILRLVPSGPIAGSDFTNFLNNLTITASDLSFNSSLNGNQIGTASGVATFGPGSINLNQKQIFQHFVLVPQPSPQPPAIVPQAVATAVIVVNTPPSVEYDSTDIRLVMTRGAQVISEQIVAYNVVKSTVGSLPTSKATLIGKPVALTVTVPAPISGAFVLIPEDGSAPNYALLKQAIEDVLQADPAGAGANLASLSPLSPEQSRHIAREITWNRSAYPTPDSQSSVKKNLEDLYTNPPNTGEIDKDEEKKRKQFEADLSSYNAKHNADADHLAGFVFAVSAAVYCQKLSEAAARAGLKFPIRPQSAVPLSTVRQAEVILATVGGLTLNFSVPAEYFYALGASMSYQVTPQQRFDMACRTKEAQFIAAVKIFLTKNVITEPAGVNRSQASRRLAAIGAATDSVPQYPDATTPAAQIAEIQPLINAWMAFVDSDPDKPDILPFWVLAKTNQAAGYVDLELAALTENYQPLMTVVKAIPVADIDALAALTGNQWRKLFRDNSNLPLPNLLPPYTQPGTFEERLAAFIRQVQKFFTAALSQTAPGTPPVGAPPQLDLPLDDPIAAFLAAYKTHSPGNADFLLGQPWDEGALQLAIQDVFPNDPDAQSWLAQSVKALSNLVLLTSTSGATPAEQLSLMEALYARGFTSPESVGTLTQDDFQSALTGSVAYDKAVAIYSHAILNLTPQPTPGSFQPINPDGQLVNCIPPRYLSPLGPVAYLAELLKVTVGLTCDGSNIVEGDQTLGDLLAARRGPLGALHATRANLETPLPLIDLVNESLEALAATPGSSTGAVYDTAADTLAGHLLEGGASSDPGFRHDPTTLFAALSEHSSPATPVEKPDAYKKLKSGFSAPILPYSQPLDLSRAYLRQFDTNRYAVMRRFRKNITEFVINPAKEPADFQSHLWRYPVRIEIAREYLDITPEEYDLLFTREMNVSAPGDANALNLWEVYGFEQTTVNSASWTETVVHVEEFLKRTGLEYCQFYELWKSEFVLFHRVTFGDESPDFPTCEACCPDKLIIQFEEGEDPAQALKRLMVFIRLWHKLQGVKGAHYSFAQLRDICEVLGLFTGGAINPDFIRQLAAFQTLRDHLGLRLSDRDQPPSGATGAARTPLLALWVGDTAAQWQWAVAHLLDRVEDYSEARHKNHKRAAEFIKIIANNLDPLSILAGFNPSAAAETWHARPTNTLRFSEALSKIYASGFGVGEILYLFAANDHLGGDDPFPLNDPNEAFDSPFEYPDDEEEFSLWKLRRKLLDVKVTEGEVTGWSWLRIVNALQEDFGYTPLAANDPLESLGQHFFPSILEHAGIPVSASERLYSAGLAGSNAQMWNTPPEGPFRYDVGKGVLFAQLPLRDEAVNQKLIHIRALNDAEKTAVRELYFAPRADLAAFSYLFANFGEADTHLIQEEDEKERWAYFRREFALFYARCKLIAEHLAEHVSHVTQHESKEDHGIRLAWRLLRHLFADENLAKSSWEDDSGKVPDVTWGPLPNGGAFAALLGLTGTGLLGEIQPANGSTIWREMRGPLDAFGEERNEWNSPFPTVLPAMDLTASQERFALLRNGLALRSADGVELGGGQGFTIRWSGVLLVENAGSYEFYAGAPTPHGVPPDLEAAEHRAWRVTLRRGQKTWVLLNSHWQGEQAPDGRSGPLNLRRGAYQLVIEFKQPQVDFLRVEETYPQRTGFQVKYSGPDSENELVALPLDKLYRDTKDTPLGDQLKLDGQAKNFLAFYYPSSLRDIRRTYQRAFKALLFASRFGLSAKPAHGDVQSKIGYLLDHAEDFAGRAYFHQGGGFSTHQAFFNFNLLPLKDTFLSPKAAQDIRTAPSIKRQQALFDGWERIFDYVILRKETRAAQDQPAWRLFYQAAEDQPDDPSELIRSLDVDARHASLVLQYFQDSPLDRFSITIPDLEDERWPVRVWYAEKWIKKLQKDFYEQNITEAQPDLWASDDPSESIKAGLEAGNENLTRFLRKGSFENKDPHRYEDVKKLNDGLRERARASLLAYLCAMSRVPLPAGGFAQKPTDLSDLLLQDVQVGICEKASRVEDAISAVQAFIQRARLGLEPGFVISPQLALYWDSRLATFQIWELCERRELYAENWIEWDALQKAAQSEAFRFLESELRRTTFTAPTPGGMTYWPDQPLPEHPGLTFLQRREPALTGWISPPKEGLGLQGKPERHARPSWLAAINPPTPHDNGNGDGNGDGNGNPGIRNLEAAAPGANAAGEPDPNPTPNPIPPGPLSKMPLWVQAAIKLGVRFFRIAAAGEPPASQAYVPHDPAIKTGCCIDCDETDPAYMDEYYFWMVDTRHFVPIEQDADWGAAGNDQLSDWHNPATLPERLYWDSEPMVHLYWVRVHDGEFQQPRRSDEGVPVLVDNPGGPGQPKTFLVPELKFQGRLGDSLRFQVVNGATPAGYDTTDAPGFRYDMATDTAAVLPQVLHPADPPQSVGGLAGYPFFVYFSPGAPLVPTSLFGPAVAVAAALRAHCHYEAALKWYELYFNPLKNDDTWAQCAPPDGGTTDGNPTIPNPNAGPNDLVPTHGNPDNAPHEGIRSAQRLPTDSSQPCCPGELASPLAIEERAVVLNYLETLFQWGDAVMSRNTPEAYQQARLIFDTAVRILGDHPRTVNGVDDGSPVQVIGSFTPHFAPLNPRLLKLYDFAADRLALVHACLSRQRLLNGRPNLALPYFGSNHRLAAGPVKAQVCLTDEEWCLPTSPYRFLILQQKAMELAGEVRNLGSALLAAYEKGDVEYLASLHATHERQILDLTLEVRQNQWREADWQVQSMQKGKELAQTNKRFYEKQIRDALKGGEISYQVSTALALVSQEVSRDLDLTSMIMGFIPDIFVGTMSFTQIPVGTKLATTFATAGRIAASWATTWGTNGGLDLTEAGWERRDDEWHHQVEDLGIEIEQIERQILAAERRRDGALRELNNHQRQMENSAEVQDFLRDKFTNHALFLFLQQETAALYHQMYELAVQEANQAQRAFNYERGFTERRFLPDPIWDNLHEGLLAGERLTLSVRQMEKAYYDENAREYELTKHISLRTHFPFSYLQLLATGKCEIEIPEWMFDMDYPGQYMRRIKNMSITIPCVAGPYTGVHCRLTLLSSATRADPRLIDPPPACCDDPREVNGYDALPDDDRIVRQYAAKEAIATSTAQNDPGLFELTFRDERYLPFEFSGAVSRWRIELPQENNPFDLETVSDVILHLNYTAREGGEVLRSVANELAQQHLPSAGIRFFDIQHDMPDIWQIFQAAATGKRLPRQFSLRLKRNMFPFLPSARQLVIDRIDILFDAPGTEPGANLIVEFLENEHKDERINFGEEREEGEVTDIRCVASVEWPDLYHGTLDPRKQKIVQSGWSDLGIFRFPDSVKKVESAYLFCAYHVKKEREG